MDSLDLDACFLYFSSEVCSTYMNAPYLFDGITPLACMSVSATFLVDVYIDWVLIDMICLYTN
jgi:hypothetical protein